MGQRKFYVQHPIEVPLSQDVEGGPGTISRGSLLVILRTTRHSAHASTEPPTAWTAVDGIWKYEEDAEKPAPPQIALYSPDPLHPGQYIAAEIPRLLLEGPRPENYNYDSNKHLCIWTRLFLTPVICNARRWPPS